jgi:hypothetical protein
MTAKFEAVAALASRHAVGLTGADFSDAELEGALFDEGARPS